MALTEEQDIVEKDLTAPPAPQGTLPTDLQQLLDGASKVAPVSAPAKKEAEPEAPSDIQQLLKESQGVKEETAPPSRPEPTAPAPTAPQEGEISRVEDDYKRRLEKPTFVDKTLRPVKALARGWEQAGAGVNQVLQMGTELLGAAPMARFFKLNARILQQAAQTGWEAPPPPMLDEKLHAKINAINIEYKDNEKERLNEIGDAMSWALWRQAPVGRALEVTAEGTPSWLTAIAVTIITKNPWAGAAVIGTQQAGGTYAEAREAGVGKAKSGMLAVLDGAWATVTEKIPFDVMLGNAGKRALTRMAQGAITEGLQEVIQQISSNAIAKFGWDEGRNVLQGWLESLVGGIGLGAIGGGVIRGQAAAKMVTETAPDTAPVIAGQAIPPAGAVDAIAPAEVTFPPITAAEAALPPAEGVRLTEIDTPRLIQAAKPPRQVVSQEIMHTPAITALPESQRVAIANVLDDADVDLESLTPESLADLLQKAEPPPPAPPTAAERVKAITDDIKGRDDPELTAKMKAWKKKAKKEGWNDEVTAQGLEALVKPIEAPTTAKAAGEPIAEEARKYKTVEEFVKTQGKPLYHGTDKDFKELDFVDRKSQGIFGEKPSEAKVLFLTETPEHARFFAEWRGKGTPRVIEQHIRSDAKIADLTGWGTSKGVIEASELTHKIDQEYGELIDEGNATVQNAMNDVGFITKLKQHGYDGVKFREPEGKGITTAIINKDILISKSQLADIWNKAQAEPPAKPSAEGKGAEIFDEGFKNALMGESMGGNAGANRSAVNYLHDGKKVVFWGNFQNAPDDIKAAFKSGELQNGTVHVEWGKEGKTVKVVGLRESNLPDMEKYIGKEIDTSLPVPAKGEIIPNAKDLKITNLDQLARGTGARYLEVARGEDGALIAKQWRRKPIDDAILVDMEPTKKPIAPSPPTKPYIPVQGESLIPKKGAGEGALTLKQQRAEFNKARKVEKEQQTTALSELTDTYPTANRVLEDGGVTPSEMVSPGIVQTGKKKGYRKKAVAPEEHYETPKMFQHKKGEGGGYPIDEHAANLGITAEELRVELNDLELEYNRIIERLEIGEPTGEEMEAEAKYWAEEDVKWEALQKQLQETGEEITSDQVKVGTEFTIGDERFHVTAKGDMGFEVKDGKHLWIPYETPQIKGERFFIDKGSLKNAVEPAKEAAKGELFPAEDLSLVGKEVADTERITQERAAVDERVANLERMAQELPGVAPEAKSPYADVAAQIVNIIQNRPLIAAETDQNLAVASENKRIGETAKPRNIVTPAIPANPVDVKALAISARHMAEQRSKGKVADLTLRQIGISDIVDVMGDIEETTGQPGVLEDGRAVERGRHAQEKTKIAFLEGLESEAKSSMDDIHLLVSDEVQKVAVQHYLDTGEGRENVNPHWQGVIDYCRKYMYEHTGPENKYLRTEQYCVKGKTKGWTPEQEVLLAPLREAYLRTIEDGTATDPNNAYIIARDEFLASPSSDILLRKNYFPHKKPDVGSIDDAVVFARSLVKNYKDNQPPPTRSQTALKVREDNRPMDEIVDNPLLHLMNHISRTEVNYYLGEPLNALHAKLIAGVYPDSRLANQASIDAGAGVPIVSKYTQDYLQKWYTNLMGMRPPPNIWENLLYRARGNLWKAIAFGVWLKEAPQRFFSGVNDPRYVKLHELGTLKYVREKVDAEIKAMFPNDADRMLRDLDYDVLLGRMIARELGAMGKDNLLSFKNDGWRAAIAVPAHIMTDNAFIHWLNRIPIVGGDQHCDLVVNSDALNRTTGWIEWVRKGKDFIIDRNLSYEELKGPLRLNRLNNAERALFVKMLVSGQRMDALLFNAERQVTIGNFRYDQKLSSFFEQSTVGRHLSQYSKWWRGLSSLVWRDWRSVTHQDWLSEDPVRMRINGVKTFVTMATLYSMSNLIYRYFTGNWDEQEDEEALIENFWRNYRAQFRVGPYAPTILGNVNTLATPINMLYRFEARSEMPAQVLESFKNLGSLTVGTTMNLTRAYLYRLEGMSSGDEKAYKKADELLWKTTKDAMKKGKSYFLQYSAISKWIFKIMDKYGAANPVGYPVDSGNWFRAGIDRVLEKTGAPDWWKWYEPEEADEEAQWEKISGVIFRLDKPKDKEEKLKPVVPLR